MPDPRRVASDLSPTELDAVSQITPEDIERAKVAAERDGSALLNAMLKARGAAA